jgi:5-methylcytosine-specific restriction enzyme subunit McrC
LRIRAILDEASVLADRRDLEMPQITPLNARYASALALSNLILSNTSVASRAGPVSTTTFLFDMNEVFESFLFTALRESLARHGGVVDRQVPGALDIAERPRLTFRADIVWRVNGKVRAVVDSNYKSLYATGSMPNADAYQMLAYCIGYGLHRGFLVYARDATTRTREHVIQRHGYVIDVRAVDVELQPAELLAEIDLLADAIAESARGPRVSLQQLEQTA